MLGTEDVKRNRMVPHAFDSKRQILTEESVLHIVESKQRLMRTQNLPIVTC